MSANRVVVLRIERTEPVHISEVISELLPKLACRAGCQQRRRSGKKQAGRKLLAASVYRVRTC